MMFALRQMMTPTLMMTASPNDVASLIVVASIASFSQSENIIFAKQMHHIAEGDASFSLPLNRFYAILLIGGDYMKKIFSIIIVFVMIFSLSGCKERFDPAPQITEGEFPFVVEYEINGERHLIEDTVVCRFDGYNSAINNFAIFGYPSSRKWATSLLSGNEDAFGIWIMELDENTESIFKKGRINYESFVFIDYGTAEYYMGDTEAIFYDEPRIRYYEHHDETPDVSFTTLTNEQLEECFGIKIIRFEFSEPIENKFE